MYFNSVDILLTFPGTHKSKVESSENNDNKSKHQNYKFNTNVENSAGNSKPRAGSRKIYGFEKLHMHLIQRKFCFQGQDSEVGDFLDKAIYKEDINGKDSEKY